MEKARNRFKLAFTLYFVLICLGKHWSNDMMMLADCYRVSRLDAVPDLLGSGDLGDGAQSYRCWCSFVSTSFAGLVSHSTHKHGFHRAAYNYLTDHGDCFGCLRTFHAKRRLFT